MPNYDDLFTGQPTQQEEKPFDKTVWAARKQAEREGVYAMIDNYVQNMSKEGGLFQASEQQQQFLDAQQPPFFRRTKHRSRTGRGIS